MKRSLFDFDQHGDKSSVNELIKKSKKRTATTSRRGGNSILDKVQAIIQMVRDNLGQFEAETLIIRDEQTLCEYVSKCTKNGTVAIDTETTGLNPLLDKIVGVCIYTQGEQTAYIPLEHINYITLEKEPNQLDKDVVARELARLSECKEIVEHNAKFDTRFIRSNLGINLVCTWDTYLASMLIDENESTHALKPLHQKYVLGGVGDAFKFDELFHGVDFRYVPIKTASLYAAHDPKITWELKEWQNQSDLFDEGSRWVFQNIEMPCVQVMADLEDTGIKFDFEYNEKLQEEYNRKLEVCRDELAEMLIPYKDKILATPKLEFPINYDSPSQLSILLYNVMKIEPVRDKRTNEPILTTGVEILSQLKSDFTAKVLEYRALGKLVGTYIDKLPKCVLEDGRVHCSFNQYGALTGRMSSSVPNLQKIPAHNKDIRQMFTASEGYLLMSSDFSQQEPKALAALCNQRGDSQMYDTFMEGKDLYSEIASKAFNKPYEQCREFDENGNKNPPEYKERRTQAKSILLGVLYGRGVPSIAEQLHTTVDKASEIKESVFRGFPAIEEFEKSSLEMAREKGYVTTVCGRRRRLPDLQLDEFEFKWKDGVSPFEDPLDFDHDTSDIGVPEMVQQKYLKMLKRCKFNEKRKVFEKANKDDNVWIIDNGAKISDATRQCVNARIQGSAADLTKIAMIELHKNEELKQLGFRMLVPVHDEVICECPEHNIKRCSELLAETMSKAAEKILRMPIKCDTEISKSWYGDPITLD